jgi:hypothetical protein
MLLPSEYNGLEVILMSTKINELLQEVQKLPYEELIVLYKAIIAQIATPLRNPEEMFDDWNDSEVDKAYCL